MNLDDIKKLATKDGLLEMIKNWDAKQRFIAGFCTVVLFLFIIKLIFDPGHQHHITVQSPAETQVAAADEVIEDSLKAVKPSPVAVEAPAAQQKLTKPYYTKPIHRYSDPEFSDVNDVQLPAARKNGLKREVEDRAAAQALVDQGGLVFVGASPLFYVEDMNFSVPYLVPKAHKLLSRVGLNFVDSLRSKGLPLHKVIVTSVLRTRADVKKLKKSNVNATEQSCHQYGTTFDITYVRFRPLDPEDEKDYRRYHVQFKRALGEVLRDLRYEGRCFVKHESKQSCFHVTVR